MIEGYTRPEQTTEERKSIMDNIKNGMKEFMSNIGGVLHKIGFWFIVLVLSGVLLGGFAMNWYQNVQMDKAILLGGFVYGKDSKVYDIKERIK